MNAKILQRNGSLIDCILTIHRDRIILSYSIQQKNNISTIDNNQFIIIYKNLIYKFKISSKNPNVIKLLLYNFHHFKITFDTGNDMQEIVSNFIHSNSFSQSLIHSHSPSLNPNLAFIPSSNLNPPPSSIPPSSSLIEDYTVIRDYERLFGNDSRFRLSTVNLDYSMSSSYPSRIIVPSIINDECLVEASKFRVHGTFNFI